MLLSKKINQDGIKTDNVLVLKQKGKTELNKLKKLDNMNYQVEFINAMVNGHTDALNAINQDLAKVNNAALKNHLNATKVKVAQHLQAAKKLQTKLSSNKLN